MYPVSPQTVVDLILIPMEDCHLLIYKQVVFGAGSVFFPQEENTPYTASGLSKDLDVAGKFHSCSYLQTQIQSCLYLKSEWGTVISFPFSLLTTNKLKSSSAFL